VAEDVQTITGLVNGVKPLERARLCNFRTGEHAPRDTHIEWINNTLRNAVAGSPNPWVDIYAYASRKGTNTGYDNQALSERRRGAIHDAIVTAIPRAGLIKQDKAFGASQSGGDANDNDGYWRAVAVYAYGELPKKREPDPVPPPPPPKPKPNPTPMPRPDWWVNSFSVGGLSVVIDVGGGFADGTIGFENLTSGETITDRIRIGGFSVGESAGVDKLKKVADILAKSAIAKKAIEWMLNSLSAGRESWRSWAIGPVWADARLLEPHGHGLPRHLLQRLRERRRRARQCGLLPDVHRQAGILRRIHGVGHRRPFDARHRPGDDGEQHRGQRARDHHFSSCQHRSRRLDRHYCERLGGPHLLRNRV
jgi:hypothetical protein